MGTPCYRVMYSRRLFDAVVARIAGDVTYKFFVTFLCMYYMVTNDLGQSGMHELTSLRDQMLIDQVRTRRQVDTA